MLRNQRISRCSGFHHHHHKRPARSADSQGCNHKRSHPPHHQVKRSKIPRSYLLTSTIQPISP
ncbi:MAG TPA: hypothetical protein EYP58_03320 [bacterium (Candidatus Stahlbacteria)]|nr:hypothetical protein [Candidatus Stahlbacteria bacterium]